MDADTAIGRIAVSKAYGECMLDIHLSDLGEVWQSAIVTYASKLDRIAELETENAKLLSLLRRAWSLGITGPSKPLMDEIQELLEACR